MKTQSEKEIQAKEIIDQSKFNSWWVDSKFNLFTVIDKRTPAWSDGKRYFVIKQNATGEYFEREVLVGTYYSYEKGDYISYKLAQSELITDEAINAYNEETGSNLPTVQEQYLKYWEDRMEESRKERRKSRIKIIIACTLAGLFCLVCMAAPFIFC